MKQETKERIIRTLVEFAEKSSPSFSPEELRRAFPFHTLFFNGESLRAFKQQRTIVTRMGMTLYPKIAEIVAKDKFQDVRLNYKLVGGIPRERVMAIEQIITELREGKREPDFGKETEQILRSKVGAKEEISFIADLYIGDFVPGPFFAEIKTPRPNLDICAESKKKMLFFRAVFAERNPQAFLAFPYNPFITREAYNHPFTKSIMDMNNEVLIGSEMWDKLGGQGTFEELLTLIKEAGRRIRE
jgi:type II restriction enzyme